MSLPLSAVDAELSALCTAEVQRAITGLRIEPLSLPLAQIDKLLEALGTPGALAASALSHQGRAAPANDITATKTPRPPARGPRAPAPAVRPGMPRMPSFDPPATSARPAAPRASTRGVAPQAPLPPTRRDLPPVRIAMAPPAPPPAEPAAEPPRALEEVADAHGAESPVAPAAAAPSSAPTSAPTAPSTLPVANAATGERTATTPSASELAPADLSRDPDAEFDALLADASSPSVFPQRSRLEAHDDAANYAPRDARATDVDVLAALAGDGPATEKPASASAASTPPYPEDPTTEVDDGIEIEVGAPMEGDATDVLEQSPLAEMAASNDAPGIEEIDLADLELTVEDDEGPHPPPVPDPKAATPDQAPSEKRPSFLGRLFGPRKSEPQG
ncbi:MAG: hypothetical protein RL385_2669 [Pseudomonadota bacterium]|jgi:hypothetical protein